MKTKTYKNGTITGKSYMKTVGHGFEVGFKFGGKTVFVGNFIHSAEANKWWARMNQDIKTFSTRHPVGNTYPKAWFTTFIKNHLYKDYYQFLDTLFTKYKRDFTREVTRNERKYKQMKKTWTPRERSPFLKAA